MKQPGFSALELIIVMAISAMIMTCLLTMYNQVSGNMNKVDRFVFEDMQLLALKNRLSKDFAGLSAIWFTQEQLEEKKLAKAGSQAPEQEKKKSSNYFYSINKDKNLELLTFVTTSSLQSYNHTQERFVRVVYQLEIDQKHKGMFRLMRKEISAPTEIIDDQALKTGTFYELVCGIASLEMTYHLIDVVALKKQQQSASPSKESENQKIENKKDDQPVIRSVKQWKDEKKKKDDKKNIAQDTPQDDQEKEDLGGAAVPKFVSMNIVFGTTDQQKKKEYVLEFLIPSNLENVPQGMLAIKKPQAVKPLSEDKKESLDNRIEGVQQQ